MKLVTKTLWQLLMRKKKYRELKRSIRKINSQEVMLKKLTWLKMGKNRINEVIKLLLITV